MTEVNTRRPVSRARGHLAAEHRERVGVVDHRRLPPVSLGAARTRIRRCWRAGTSACRRLYRYQVERAQQGGTSAGDVRVQSFPSDQM